MPEKVKPRRILLITAASPAIQKVRQACVLNFQQITMPYLAAFVPKQWEMIHIDEAATPVDVTLPINLAYTLAFRYYGK